MSVEMTYQDYARYAKKSLDELASECHFEAFHAKGPGGQGVNTADSAVRLVHTPTGISTTSRQSRSQYRNRRLCLGKLKAELLMRSVPPKSRLATRPSHASVLKRLVDKKRTAELKKTRRRVDEE